MVTASIHIDDSEFRAWITKVKGRKGKVPFKFTKKISDDLYMDLKSRLTNVSGQGPRHNTPQKLQSGLHTQKVKEGHKVWFDSSVKPLVTFVESGTKPHAQPNNPIFRSGGHPGARAKNFWRDATRRTQTILDPQMKRLAEEMFRR